MAMKPIQVTRHVDKDGKLELGKLPSLPPSENLSVLIMQTKDMTALGKMLDIVASTEIADPELLQQLEALDEALWDRQFANSQDVLAKMAEQVLAEHEQGTMVELDLGELLGEHLHGSEQKRG